MIRSRAARLVASITYFRAKAEAYVRDGRAVWLEDVGDDGTIDGRSTGRTESREGYIFALKVTGNDFLPLLSSTDKPLRWLRP
jgi:hypothetical protein